MGSFDEDIKQIQGTGVIVFSSPYCSTCKKVVPRVESLVGTYEKLRLLKVDITTNPPKAAEYQVMHIPTIVFFKDNKEINRLSGDIVEKEIKDQLEQLL